MVGLASPIRDQYHPAAHMEKVQQTVGETTENDIRSPDPERSLHKPVICYPIKNIGV